jgi:hypothetical protein
MVVQRPLAEGLARSIAAETGVSLSVPLPSLAQAVAG